MELFDEAPKIAEMAFTNEATTFNIALRMSLMEEPSEVFFDGALG